jgi:predicted dehydrogenase
MLGVGLVGYGYWGPNLARNFSQQADCRLLMICEQKKERLEIAARTYPAAQVTSDYNELLKNEAIQAILIATPVASHFPLAKAALLADKDVLVEKPLTRTVAEARELIKLAEGKGRILAVDHTFLFTGAVRKIKEIVDSGELGQIIYIDSIRINLGLFQPDVNVIYDLAPHDLSIVCHLLDQDPITVRAMGSCHSHIGLEHIAYLHLEYPEGLIAHFHLSWLSPLKIRRTVIGGMNKMILYDDLERSEKVKIYDKGIVVQEGDVDSIYRARIDYRTGDMVAPKLMHREALNLEAEHFLSCVRNRTRPTADGQMGLRVIRILEAAQTSIRNNGSQVRLEDL